MLCENCSAPVRPGQIVCEYCGVGPASSLPKPSSSGRGRAFGSEILSLPRDLWCGELPLAVAYWFFGVFGALAVKYVGEGLAASTPSASPWIFCLAIAYVVVVLVGIWRSASRYKGPAVWQGAAKVWVVFGWIGLVGTLGNISTEAFREPRQKEIHAPGGHTDARSEEFLSKVADQVNKSMPQMVDAETEIMNLGAGPAVIIYNYRLVHIKKSAISEAKLRNALRPQIVRTACSTQETRTSFLDKDVAMRYCYFDQDRNYIGGFDVTRSDCSQTAPSPKPITGGEK